MTSEEAELEFVIIAQKLDGYGDEYYPAKVSDLALLRFCPQLQHFMTGNF